MKEKILKICRDLCCKKIEENEELIVSGLLDSFKIMELICRIEEQFNIVFLPDEIMELENFSSVNNLYKIVCNKNL